MIMMVVCPSQTWQARPGEEEVQHWLYPMPIPGHQQELLQEHYMPTPGHQQEHYKGELVCYCHTSILCSICYRRQHACILSLVAPFPEHR